MGQTPLTQNCVRLRDLSVIDRTELGRARSLGEGSNAEEHDFNAHTGAPNCLAVQWRPSRRMYVALCVCILCGFLAHGVWMQGVSAEVRTALDLFWVEAIEGGLSGAAAMVVQVLTLMWIRTTMNYQYKHGGTFRAAFSTLYNEGGVMRLYAGLTPCLIQGPLSRFGDTAANDGVRAALKSLPSTARWSSTYVSILCSLVAGSFRVVLMPLEVVKTSMQVQGAGALTAVGARISRRGPCVLWEGLLATFGAHFSGHLPWFGTRDLLLHFLPIASTPMLATARAALIGLASSLVADLLSNPLRVLKTHKQTSEESLSYPQAVRQLLAQIIRLQTTWKPNPNS